MITVPIPLTLTPLGADDADLLFGRDTEVETIVHNCRSSRLTVITSSAGLGVSSLIRAGAEPALRHTGEFVTVLFSDWQGPNVAPRLRQAILTAIHEQADSGFSVDYKRELLYDILTKAQAKIGRPVAVLIDQFEDYVRCHSGTDLSNQFDAELANAISSRAGRFVIALQKPCMNAFERLGQYIPNLLGFTIDLPPLTESAAIELIRAAAKRADLEIEDAAVTQLVTAPTVRVADGAHTGVHPLFVSLGAQRLFEAEKVLRSRQARLATLAENGGADQMILTSLDGPIRQLGVTHSELFFRWIPLLISSDRRRLAPTEKALLEHAGRWNRFGSSLLPLLVRSGLMRTIAVQAGDRYELARESATVVAYDWWQRAEATIIARRRVRFTVRAISIVVGAIIVAYLIYFFSSSQP